MGLGWHRFYSEFFRFLTERLRTNCQESPGRLEALREAHKMHLTES